jgi:hypothetical protein
MQVAEYASEPQGPSSRRNGRPSGGDTFDLEHLAGGQTRWREQVLDTIQGIVPLALTVPRTQLSCIALRLSLKTNIWKFGVTKDTRSLNSVAADYRTGIGRTSASVTTSCSAAKLR